MASVFGTAIIVAKDKVSDNKFCYMAETEDGYKDPIEFSCNKELKIGSQIYWESFYKTKEFFITPL